MLSNVEGNNSVISFVSDSLNSDSTKVANHHPACTCTNKQIRNLIFYTLLQNNKSLNITVLWDVMLYGLVDHYWCLGGLCYVHLQSRKIDCYCVLEECVTTILGYKKMSLLPLTMGPAHSSEMSAFMYQATWCHIPKNSDFLIHHCNSLKTHIMNPWLISLY